MSADDVVRALFRDAAGTSGGTTADAPRLTGAADVERVERLLDAHRGWTYLARRAHRVAGLPTPLADRAAAERRAAVSYQIALGADLRACGGALDAAGIPWACVKGPVVAALHERRGDVRPFTDLDLLVPPARFADALRALSGAGAVLLDRNFALLRERTPGEVNVRAPLGTMVDLHWTLVNRRERRTRSRVATAPLLAGRAPVATSAGDVPALAPAERLVHLCLHAAGSGAGRLVWLLDVALTAADGADWDAVVAVARAWGVPRAVGLVLGRSRAVVGADVPADVVRGLLGRGGWGAAEAVARREGLRPPTPGRRTAGAHLAVGALEHDDVLSLLAHRAAERLRRRGPRTPFTAAPTDPGSAFYPRGSVEDLRSYLATVAAQPDG